MKKDTKKELEEFKVISDKKLLEQQKNIVKARISFLERWLKRRCEKCTKQ